jgi:alpha-L-fucosidase
MGIPKENIRILSLGKNSKVTARKVASVKMLGSSDKISWKQEDDALVISKPSELPEWPVVTFKIEFKK